MNEKPLTHIGQPVAELPVQDVVRAQAHYRDRLGFTVEWLYPGEEIGAVSRGEAVVFLRRRAQTFEPTVHWIFAEDIEATYRELTDLGAHIVGPLETQPWGLAQFTVEDLDGHRVHFHHG